MKPNNPCPMCVNSSGILPFTPYTQSHGQKCTDCNGTGFVSATKLKKLKKEYGDLI